MAHLITELPKVMIIPGKMISYSKLKLLLLLMAVLFYVYLVSLIKTYYLKNKRLDHIFQLALQTKQRMMNVHKMDKTLAMHMARLDKLYEDY